MNIDTPLEPSAAAAASGLYPQTDTGYPQDHRLPIAVVDCHSHTAAFSNDAQQTIHELLADARSIGLAGICCTEHYDKDITYRDGQEEIFDIADCFAHVQPLRTATLDQPTRLYIGIELGWTPQHAGLLANIASRWSFDSIILSLHLLDGLDMFRDREIFDDGASAAYRRAIVRMLDMVQSCPDFDILGHFDYISRYAPQQPRLCYKDAPAAFDALFSHLAANNKALEINTRTVSKFRQIGRSAIDCWPDPQIIRRYRELGGQLITLGADSHQNGQAGGLFAETIEYLRHLGVRHLAHFVNRQPVLTAII